MSNYIDPLAFRNDISNGYYFYLGDFYIGERNSGRLINTIPDLLVYLFGGTCVYHYDICLMIHHYTIKNDDIGVFDLTVANECFVYENFDTRIQRMCEEYDNYMRYQYRDYIRKEKEHV